MCKQKLVENSLIYHSEPKQKPEMLRNGEQPGSIVSVREKERRPMVGKICDVGFELGVKE